MTGWRQERIGLRLGGGLLLAGMAALSGCGAVAPPPPPPLAADEIGATPDYVISPLDTVQVSVWQAPELSVTAPVRPDGRITIPLIEDMPAAGRTPTKLARDIEAALQRFVKQPKVSVVMASFADYADQTVKVIGEVKRPTTIPFRPDLSVLDVLVAAEGLTEFAAGNDAKLIRKVSGQETIYRLRLQELIGDGNIEANAKLRPGDMIVVPKSLL